MPMSSRVKALSGCQKAKRPRSSSGEQQFEAGRQRGRQQAGEHQQRGERLDRRVEGRPAQDVDLEGGTHELGQRALEHDQEGDAEEAERHAPAEVEVLGREQQRLGREEQRQDEQEEDVVDAVAVAGAMADQRREQQGDDGRKEQVGGDQEKRGRPASAEAHGDTLDDPGGGQRHQDAAVVAADADPVLAGGQQEAAEYRPAEAVEHLVSVPLRRREGRRRGRQHALEDQDPDDGQGGAGEAGEGEEGTEADQPERMRGKDHGSRSRIAEGRTVARPAARRLDLAQRRPAGQRFLAAPTGFRVMSTWRGWPSTMAG